MSVPMFPLGDLDTYPLSTLETLVDQHMERASELQRKLESVVQRGRAIQAAIDAKVDKARTTMRDTGAADCPGCGDPCGHLGCPRGCVSWTEPAIDKKASVAKQLKEEIAGTVEDAAARYREYRKGSEAQ